MSIPINNVTAEDVSAGGTSASEMIEKLMEKIRNLHATNNRIRIENAAMEKEIDCLRKMLNQ